jgi:hypothetical protein
LEEQKRHNSAAHKILGNQSLKQSQESRLELGLCLSQLMPMGERSGLLTHIGATESVSLCVPMKSRLR